MKIAFVAAAWPGEDSPNGAVAAVRHLAAGFREIGCTVRIIPHEGAPAEDVILPPPPPRPGLPARLAGRLGLADPWIEAIGARLARPRPRASSCW